MHEVHFQNVPEDDAERGHYTHSSGMMEILSPPGTGEISVAPSFSGNDNLAQGMG
jgi:hypothetical protein